MAQTYTKYYNGIQAICGSGGSNNMNMGSDSFVLVLTNTAPTLTTATYSAGNVTEIATGGGYTQGTGISIYGATFTNTTGTSTLTGQASLFTASGAVAQFDYVILYDVTAAPSASPFSAGHPLIGFWQCVSAISMASTDTFQVSWGSNQILQFS